MSTSPIITFKAGRCEVDSSSKPFRVTADPRSGYIHLYNEDDLIHVCWRPRNVSHEEPEIDLITVPGDCRFIPYDTRTPTNAKSKTNGRIFVLKFSSSSERYLFWLQSKPQGRSGDPAWLSPRDRKLGDMVDRLLQGEEVNVNRELAAVRNSSDDSRRDSDDDNDTTMDDADDTGGTGTGTGGAGADATGGDVRREGENAREGGADGARATPGGASSTSLRDNPEAAAAVRNFLASLHDSPSLGNSFFQPSTGGDKLYPQLTDLLDTSSTLAMIDSAPESQISNLLSFLPPAILQLTREDESVPVDGDLSLAQQRALLKKVVRSPQFHQSLAGFSAALRGGGLPTVAEALGVQVENGGYVMGSRMPLGGGAAVEAFVEGVKGLVKREMDDKK